MHKLTNDIVNTPKLWDSRFHCHSAQKQLWMSIYDFLRSTYYGIIDHHPMYTWKNNDHFQVFLSKKKISIGILYCDVMLLTHANHAFCITIDRITWNNTPMQGNFEWEVQLTFSFQLLPINKLSRRWKLCNTNYFLVIICKIAVNNKRHCHLSRVTQKNDCLTI